MSRILDEGARRIEGDLLAEWFEQNTLAEEPEEARGAAVRHQDTKLQTPYAGPILERRLLNTYYASRSTIEEQGVNTLYLALGMLRWFEAASGDTERSAPLVLIPVTLDRTSARSRFRLRYTGDDLGDNLSLQAKLRRTYHPFREEEHAIGGRRRRSARLCASSKGREQQTGGSEPTVGLAISKADAPLPSSSPAVNARLGPETGAIRSDPGAWWGT